MGRLPPDVRARIDRSPTLGRFLNLAGWTTVAFALDKVTTLIIALGLARVLGAEDYGRLTLALGLVNCAQIFVVLGAGTLLARHVPALREQSVKRAVEIINLCASVVLGTAALLTVAGLIGASWVATQVLELAASSPVPYLMLGWVLLTAANGLMSSIMLSFEMGRTLGAVSLLSALVSITLVPSLALTLGLAGAVAALMGVEAARAALLLTFYSRLLTASDVPLLTPARRSDIPLLWRFGLPVFLTSALWAPTLWLAQLIIKTSNDDGLVAVGIFGLTNSILGAVIVFSSLTNRAALPVMASLQERGALAELRRVARILALSQTALAAAIGLPLALAAPFIMAVAGPAFADDWPVATIMIVTGIVIAGQTALGNHLMVKGRAYALLGTMLTWSILVIAVTVIFRTHGPYALAAALLIASAIRTAAILALWLQQEGRAKPGSERAGASKCSA